MNRHGYKGSITVFLSLTCILFLSLICAVVESARVQGARAQAANITGMGSFSLLGEFEKELLEKYDIFSLDGTYGNGSFQIEKVNERLQDYISYNANPRKDLFSAGCFDPWRLELDESSISGYALLTDEQGEPFYQQAVTYMKENTLTMTAEKLLEYAKDTEDIEKWEKEYKESLKDSDTQISQMEDTKQKKLETMESEAEAAGTVAVLPEEPKNNPLKEIAKLRKKSTLEIVTWDKEISKKTINIHNFPSKNRLRKGNLAIEKKNSGLLSDLIFREYLLEHFPGYADGSSGKVLDYQMEYILGGKKSDEKNLKYVVNRLLLLREGMNYLYCLKEPAIHQQTEALALTLTGIFGLPLLTEATNHALMLAWAYGESLVDVRILLDGGKVPIFKDVSTWSLSLENLGRITEVLREGAKRSDTGLSYTDYLRVLLNLGSVKKQRMRALDMIQAELQEEGSTQFKAENCIVAVKVGTSFYCKPVFAGLPSAIFRITAGDVRIKQKSSMAY